MADVGLPIDATDIEEDPKPNHNVPLVPDDGINYQSSPPDGVASNVEKINLASVQCPVVDSTNASDVAQNVKDSSATRIDGIPQAGTSMNSMTNESTAQYTSEESSHAHVSNSPSSSAEKQPPIPLAFAPTPTTSNVHSIQFSQVSSVEPPPLSDPSYPEVLAPPATRKTFPKAPTNGEDNVQNEAMAVLTDRVSDLEMKLAALSRLLRQQRLSSAPASMPKSPLRPRSISPPTSLQDEDSPLAPSTPPPPPPPPQSDDDSPPTTSTKMPYLESPMPTTRTEESSRRKRNLSFTLLYDSGTPQLTHKQGQDPNQDIPPRPNSSDISSSTADETKEDETTDDEQTTPVDPSQEVRSKWFTYLNAVAQESTKNVDLEMEEFIRVPSAVESLLVFGFWICVDSFLYVVTILPIRFVWSSFLLILRYLWFPIAPFPSKRRNPFRFHRRHLYQLIQVSIIYTIYRYVLLPISIGRLYHWIRGQAMLKLYVLIAIVEVFDRLMCSLGQDCLDSMYWNTTRRPRSSRMCISVVVSLVYATVHTLILFVHVATLNVAMNSSDQALLTLLISGNFAEIKSTVFKKYNKPNLFKITASDICERFKLALFLGLVLVLNLCQGMDESMVGDYVHMCGIVWCAELLADWIKHSFITKFNYIPSTVYPEYALLLAGDVTGFGHEGVNQDHSHAVVKRIGLAQVPLVCVMARFLREAARYALPRVSSAPRWLLTLGCFGFWLLLLITKISLGSFLQRVSKAKLHAAPELSSKKQPAIATPKLKKN